MNTIKLKKNLPLILGLAIPVLMMLFVAASIYLPGMFVKPAYNFVYALGDVRGQYQVKDGKVTLGTVEPDGIERYGSAEPQLIKYDVTTNQVTPLTLEQAQQLKLDPRGTSPDGFEVEWGGGGGGFLFYGISSDRASFYLRGHNISRKLNIEHGANYYYGNDFRFIGWELK